MLTAIRADKGKVVGYINKLENYDIEDVYYYLGSIVNLQTKIRRFNSNTFTRAPTRTSQTRMREVEAEWDCV